MGTLYIYGYPIYMGAFVSIWVPSYLYGYLPFNINSLLSTYKIGVTHVFISEYLQKCGSPAPKLRVTHIFISEYLLVDTCGWFSPNSLSGRGAAAPGHCPDIPQSYHVRKAIRLSPTILRVALYSWLIRYSFKEPV